MRRRPGRVRRRAIASLALLLVAAWATPAGATTTRELFEEGNAAYDDGRYQEAAETYETILAYGVFDPRVYFNLGNAYFKLGRLGAAILNYERALRVAPGDRESRENLELARGLIRDRLTSPEMQYPIRVLRNLLDSLSPNGLTWAFLTFYLAAGTLMGGFLVSRGFVRRRLFGYGALAVGLCTSLLCGALVYKVEDVTAMRAIVMEDRIDVRSGPAEDNTVLFTVHEGTRLEVRNQLEGWYQVSLPNNLSGWIPESSVERV